MIIRQYKDDDLNAISKLFFETVHTVNAKDYTKTQLFAWANCGDSLKKRFKDLREQNTLVAQLGADIIGFGSIDKSGYLDLLFVHKNFQGQGVATMLCNLLEKDFRTIKTYASVTAKTFFERRGYTVVSMRETERSGVKLKSFEMIKII